MSRRMRWRAHEAAPCERRFEKCSRWRWLQPRTKLIARTIWRRWPASAGGVATPTTVVVSAAATSVRMRNKGAPFELGVSLGARSMGAEVGPSTGNSDRSERARRTACTCADAHVRVESGTFYFPHMAYETLLYDVAGSGVATITLNQPDTRNALSNEVLSELIAAFEAARDDEAVRCVVLTSSHDRVFSSGANLGGFAGDVPLVHKHFGSDRFVKLFRLIGELGKPSICAANGHVLAGSLGIALACDLIIAKDGAEFGTPEINVGAFPFMIMALIYRNVPRKRTNELLLLGDRISAQDAKEAGIVNKVVSAEDFDAAVSEWAAKLASKSPVIMRLGKDAMFRQQDMAFMDALEYLHAQLSLALSTDDIVEGVTAFFEKREPQWKGR